MQEKTPIGAYIGIIAAVIIIALGYYIWSPKEKSEEVKNNNVPENTIKENTIKENTVKDDPKNNIIKNSMHNITIETNKGKIVFETFDSDSPKTVKNFIDLANKGFYNGIIFHRVIKGFMIQGGDPTGTGRGGPGYTFEDELNPNTESYKNGYKRGVVAMANSGPDTNGSQFFIMHEDYPLPNNYTIFGRVVEGIEAVDAIANTKTGAEDKPLEPIVMKNVVVEEK